MKKRVLYSLCFLLSFVYSQEAFITESETASLIPENFVKNFYAGTDGGNDKSFYIKFRDMTAEQKKIRYTYEIYDIYIKDIPDKAKQRFFGNTLLSEFGEGYGYNLRLAEPYYSRGFISYDEIAELLTMAKKDEYVLFDNKESLTSGVRFSLHKKLSDNKEIIGETAVGFSEGCPILQGQMNIYNIFTQTLKNTGFLFNKKDTIDVQINDPIGFYTTQNGQELSLNKGGTIPW